jgi:glycosyltransferase involved in cell wall biosynthesis
MCARAARATRHLLVRGRSYETRKAQSLLLKAAKKLIDDGRLKNIHCLLVGEGPDKEMLSGLITELGVRAPAARPCRLLNAAAAGGMRARAAF